MTIDVHLFIVLQKLFMTIDVHLLIVLQKLFMTINVHLLSINLIAIQGLKHFIYFGIERIRRLLKVCPEAAGRTNPLRRAVTVHTFVGTAVKSIKT